MYTTLCIFNSFSIQPTSLSSLSFVLHLFFPLFLSFSFYPSNSLPSLTCNTDGTANVAFVVASTNSCCICCCYFAFCYCCCCSSFVLARSACFVCFLCYCKSSSMFLPFKKLSSI